MIHEIQSPANISLYEDFLRGKKIVGITSFNGPRDKKSGEDGAPGMILHLSDGSFIKIEACRSGLEEDFRDGRGPQKLLDIKFLGVTEYEEIDQTREELEANPIVHCMVGPLSKPYPFALGRKDDSTYEVTTARLPGGPHYSLGKIAYNPEVRYDGRWYIVGDLSQEDHKVDQVTLVKKGNPKTWGYAKVQDATLILVRRHEQALLEFLVGKLR